MLFVFFFNDTATTEIYTLSLHDALPISHPPDARPLARRRARRPRKAHRGAGRGPPAALGHHARPRTGGRRARRRSEEHTSELQSRQYLVCRLLLEKKKKACSENSRSKSS